MTINEEIKEFQAQLKSISEENISKCYQCGKCSAGCPCARNMSILPHMILRRIQLGQKYEVLKEDAIWQCVSCMTCWSRCPRKVNLSAIMEALRYIALTENSDLHEQKIDKLLTYAMKNDVPQQALVAGLRSFVA